MWSQIIKKYRNKIHLVIGPSSSGKSTYISENCKDLPVIMASEINKNTHFDAGNVVIHYNSLRAYSNSLSKVHRKIEDEDVIQRILGSGCRIDATVMVSSQSSLIRRAALRKAIEPALRNGKSKYPGPKIIELLNFLDLKCHYGEIISFLRKNSVNFKLINSNGPGFKEIFGESEMIEAIHAARVEYKKEEVEEILNRYRFEYHSIELPFGLRTKGDKKDFSSFECIDFSSKSVLDVGCGYGWLLVFLCGKKWSGRRDWH